MISIIHRLRARVRKNRLANSAVAPMALGLVGAAAGWFIFFAGSGKTTESQALFGTPEFVTWCFINLILLVLYPVLLWLLREPIVEIKKHIRYDRVLTVEIWISMGGLALLFAFPQVLTQVIMQPKPLPFTFSEARIIALNVIGFLVAVAPIVRGILLIRAAIAQTYRTVKPQDVDLNLYIRFRRYLEQFLRLLGILLSLFILTGVALRKVLLVTSAVAAGNFPEVYLLIFGAYYTLLLALVYLPAHQVLVSVGQRLLDACCRLPAPSSELWSTMYAKRQEVEEVLALRLTGEQRFLESITVLAPLISSALSYFVRV